MVKHILLLPTLLLAAVPAWPEDVLPETWGQYHPGRGHQWTAASRALTATGEVRTSGISEWLRGDLEEQIRGSDADHGLMDGEIADQAHCAERTSATFVSTEQDHRFISAFLLAEVAVTATLGEAAPGFFLNGDPGKLFALTDVVPLHSRSATPAYALVPEDFQVIRGRVFCSGSGVRFHVGTGDRVVLVGAWRDQGTVRTGVPGNHLALVTNKGLLRWDTLHTDSAPNLSNPPSSLVQLDQRVAEVVSGGLLQLAAHLVRQKVGSPERVQFVEELARHEDAGCRVLEAAEAGASGEGWSPTRVVCPDRDRERQARALHSQPGAVPWLPAVLVPGARGKLGAGWLRRAHTERHHCAQDRSRCRRGRSEHGSLSGHQARWTDMADDLRGVANDHPCGWRLRGLRFHLAPGQGQRHRRGRPRQSPG